MEIKKTIDIQAPIDVVFQYATSFEKTMHHYPQFKEIHCDKLEKGGTIFVTLEVNRIFYKRKLKLSYEIVDYRPPTIFEYKVPSKNFTQHIIFQHIETENGTRVEALQRFAFPNALNRFYYSLFKGFFERRMDQLLLKMKQEIEKEMNMAISNNE
jgi:hypothetical protein